MLVSILDNKHFLKLIYISKKWLLETLRFDFSTLLQKDLVDFGYKNPQILRSKLNHYYY